MPRVAPAPKSGCRGLSRPTVSTKTPELASIFNVSTGVFQILLGGKAGQPPRVGDCALTVDKATHVQMARVRRTTSILPLAKKNCRRAVTTRQPKNVITSTPL